MVHGLASLAIIALFFFIFFRYILGLAPVLSMSRVEFTEILRHFVSNHFRGGVFAFNIFIDLFLCTMFMFFLTYEPKHFFTGKRKLIFRLLSILPILYEASSIALKVLANFKVLELSPLMLLFSYNRTHKYSWIDIAIPIAGIALIVLVHIEFIYQLILQLPAMLGM